MKKLNVKKLKIKLILLLLFPAGLLLFYLVPQQSLIVEKYYSNGVYKALAQVISLSTGIFPFSVAEIGLIAIVLLVPVTIALLVNKLLRGKGNRLRILGSAALGLLSAASVVYFALVVLWLLNYNRLAFADIAGLKIQKTSVSELAEVCKYLINQANIQRTKVKEDEDGIMVLDKGYRDVFDRAVKGYEKAALIYPELKGKYGRPKPILLSKYMSYTGIEGIFCPFTAEANINVDIPQSSIPSATCHEMAHQRGFAREDEANYIAYVVCSLHPDPDFQYSGTLLALVYSMNALYEHDRAEFRKLAEIYSPGVVRDLNAASVYWKHHEGPVEEISDKVNNAYLKANKQKDGVYSYGRMVDLIIAAYKERNNP